MKPTVPTRERLAREAALLFQRKGYHGTGTAEIVAAAGVPKGSLYHHFPNGKADLAVAAARWSSDGLLRIVEDSFCAARSFDDGVATLCHKLAKFLETTGLWIGCPVSATLFAGIDDEPMRRATAELFDQWIAAVEGHARRLGRADPRADAEGVWIAIQGAFTLSRVRRDGAPLRAVPGLLGLAPAPR